MNVVTNLNDLKLNNKVYLTVVGANVERDCVIEGVTTCASFEEFKRKYQPSIVHSQQSCNELWKVDIEIGQKEYNYYTHYFPYWKNRPEFITWRKHLTYNMMTEYPYHAPIRCIVDVNGEIHSFGKDSQHTDKNNINYIIRHQID